jgi:hypothetical protein
VLDACLACGYTKADPNQVIAAAPPPKPPSQPGIIEALRLVPTWMWLLAGGCLTILVACTLLTQRLSPDGFDRAVVTTALLGAGVLGLIAATVWAVPLILKDAPDLALKDVLFPYKVWTLALGKLPHTCRPVVLLSWGLTAVVAAPLIIGGLWYWLPGKKHSKFRLEGPVAKVGSSKADAPTEEVIQKRQEVDAAEDATDKEDETKGKPTTLKCVIIGYIPHEDGMSLVLAVEEEKGVFRYAGLVRRGLNAANAEKVRSRLAPHTRVEPLIEGLPVKAVWVDPNVSCEVTQRGVGAATVLPNPVFKDLVPDPKEENKPEEKK